MPEAPKEEEQQQEKKITPKPESPKLSVSKQPSATMVNRKQKKSKIPVKIYVGRRKTSIARVRLLSGNGEFTVNRRPLKQYLRVLNLQQSAKAPLTFLEKEKKYDIFVNVKGGGLRGQAEAISLGIARALSDDDIVMRKKLRAQGLLTRDSRMVERKKYGLHKARRAPQFSKR